MKLLLFTYFIGLFALTTFALVVPQKAVIVSYPGETPDWVVGQAMDAVTNAGGVVTHEYKLIKGFAAKASAKALETVTTLSEKYLPIIEEDAVVSVHGVIIENGVTN